MWTPKRILILIVATFLFSAGFVVYDLNLGGYDGLPPLPPEYLPIADQQFDPTIRSQDDSDAEKKMRLAFGLDSDEAKRKFVMNSGTKNALLAVNQFDIEPDGRVKLSPFSVAIFGKKKPGDLASNPEVNTIQCDVAYLSLDRPVKNFTELASRRIIGVELRSFVGPPERGVIIANNRRTPEKNDDLEVRIKLAPVYYEERSNKIWTDGFVELLDTASQPNPTTVTAKGMELHLAKEAQPLRAKAPAKKNEPLGSIEQLVLKSHVEMHLYVEAQNGFLSGSADPSAKKAPPRTPGEKSHVIVQTAGSMRYDVQREEVQFDSPAPAADGAALPGNAEQVLIQRVHNFGPKNEKHDQLVCDSLKLTFRRKNAAKADAARDAFVGNKDIDTALALARPGQELTLSMDTENLVAWGSELFFRAAAGATGPQTILKGQPMTAFRDGHKIRATELHLIGADAKGNGQQAFAKGPGQIDLLDKQSEVADAKGPEGAARNGEPKYTLHALWKDSLITTKDRDGDRVYDLLTLTGDAEFIDDEQQQSLKGQRLQVWLEQKGPQAQLQNAPASSRHEPHKLEAFERVSIRSPELLLEKCQHLVVVFKQVLGTDDALPDPSPPMPPGEGKTPPGSNPPPPAPGKAANARPPLFTLPGQENKNKARQPIRLSAQEVVAYISTQGTKKQLQELVTEGDVHVQQDGPTPKDKGLDITGEMLNLIYHPLGNRLLVYGDARRLAQLRNGELAISGPKVDIDQRANTATVDGTGGMRLPSNTTFEGGKPAKGNAYVDIQWNKHMVFNGKFAEFHGGVQAHQGEAKLLCQSLQVTLDKFVSFKEGQKNEQAKIDKLVCYQKVWVEEKTMAPLGKLAAYKRLTGAALDMDNPESRVVVPGPGKVHHVAPAAGTVNPLASPMPMPAPPKSPGEPVKFMLTRIDFEGRMFATNKPGMNHAIFYDNVEVYHQPGEDPDAKVAPNQPPKDGFYMRCNNLNVSKQERDGKVTQYMVARNNVFFRTPEFFGNADVVKYDESQELIIFEGNPTVLFKLGPPGAKPQRIEGRKILYNRKTGNFSLDGGTNISSWLVPPETPHQASRRTMNGCDQMGAPLSPACSHRPPRLGPDWLTEPIQSCHAEVATAELCHHALEHRPGRGATIVARGGGRSGTTV